ncbi:4-hydroxybenzoate polyprenyltransferase [Albimonas donghaensis]|uniref:4-hydroxybenzoate polyprenyltransferase n=1 Tax=Albimonas donghaensis TaxID=356660 RepID=A0A1H3CV35_9RHOB|nr:UbiA family prenyltransferase [Albimonas donghaensis]SDX58005.1 4-hydroxybenzoate polyprenyltransferase [Albimonas donghaensis]
MSVSDRLRADDAEPAVPVGGEARSSTAEDNVGDGAPSGAMGGAPRAADAPRPEPNPDPDSNHAPEPDAGSHRGVALVIDLDGTLVPVDTLHESALGLIALGFGPLAAAAPELARAARLGKSPLKARITDRVTIDAAGLPYRESVLDLIREARAAGRFVMLATASDQRVADAVAAHLGLFDAVEGSDGTVNLGGHAKADMLIARFGRHGFDYVGDAPRDLPVWASARRVITAGASPGLIRQAEALTRPETAPEALHLDPASQGLGRIRPYIRAMRPHQWMKNTLVFLPLLASHQSGAGAWLTAMLAFAAFSLVSSSVYCVNDLLDLDADRAHPRKRFRPFASGAVPALHGLLMGAVLFCGGFGLAWAVSDLLFGVLSVYFGATLLYSMALKRELVIDICMLAGLYTLRVIAGSMALQLEVSPWMLALSVFLFLSLAAMKRQTELVDLAAEGKSETSGRAYRADDLPVVTMMAIAAGYTAVLVLALYIYSPTVQRLYMSPLLLWGAPPILLYWSSRMVMIAHRGQMNDDPVLFAIRDPLSWICGAGMLACAMVAKWY